MNFIESRTSSAKEKLIKLISPFLGIFEEDVASIIKRGVVAGGAISSLVNGETLRDIDIFLNNVDDVNNLISKLFPFGYENFKSAIIKQNGKEYSCFKTPNAISFPGRYQIVLGIYGDGMEVINQFDFLHTQAFLRLDFDYFYFAPNAVESMLLRELIYTKNEMPRKAFKRMQVRLKRGWRISLEEFIKLFLHGNLIADPESEYSK